MSRPPWRAAGRRVLVLALALGAVATAVTACPAAADEGPRYRTPVDAPVVDPFRAPTTRYGPGNRGLEYGTRPGDTVRAAANGVVTFAGLVAGSRHVTIRHGDGVRTTVSFLATIDAVVGQEVHQGEVLGTAGAQDVHFSARRGDAYFDPASLFGSGTPKVRLVPFDDPPGEGAGSDRSAIRQLFGFGGSVLGAAGRAAGAVVDAGAGAATWTADHAPQLARLALQYAPQIVPLLATAEAIRVAIADVRTAWELSHRPCTRAGDVFAPPSSRHVALLVGGLTSSSADDAVDHVDTTGLGYAPPDVLRFSYTGGRTPDGSDGLTSIPAHGYDAADTGQDLHISAARLADLVEEVVTAAPDAPVDLIAHSQGGLIARLALLELERRHGEAWLDHVGMLATLATPHSGADAATSARLLDRSVVGSLVVDTVEERMGLDEGAAAVRQLAETSEVIRTLADHPVPPGLRAVSIAAASDPIVPLPHTRLPGATQAVVPMATMRAHSLLPGDPRTTRELLLARSGAPPACIDFAHALASEALGSAISGGEDAVGRAGSTLAGPVGAR